MERSKRALCSVVILSLLATASLAQEIRARLGGTIVLTGPTLKLVKRSYVRPLTVASWVGYTCLRSVGLQACGANGYGGSR